MVADAQMRQMIVIRGDDEFAVMAIRNSVRRQILPKVSAGRFAGVGKIVVRGDAAEKSAFRIVGVLGR